MVQLEMSSDWGSIRAREHEVRLKCRPGGEWAPERLGRGFSDRRLVIYASATEPGRAVFDLEVGGDDAEQFPDLWTRLDPVALIRSDSLQEGFYAPRNGEFSIPAPDGRYTATRILETRPETVEFQDLQSAMPGRRPRIVLYEHVAEPDNVVFAPGMHGANWCHFEPVALAHAPEGLVYDETRGCWMCPAEGELFDARAVRSGKTPVEIREIVEFPWPRRYGPGVAASPLSEHVRSSADHYRSSIATRRHVIFMRPGIPGTAQFDVNVNRPFRWTSDWLAYQPAGLVEGRWLVWPWQDRMTVAVKDAEGKICDADDVIAGRAAGVTAERLDRPTPAEREAPIGWLRRRALLRPRWVDEDRREDTVGVRWHVIYGSMGTRERPFFDVDWACGGSGHSGTLYDYEPIALVRGKGLGSPARRRVSSCGCSRQPRREGPSPACPVSQNAGASGPASASSR